MKVAAAREGERCGPRVVGGVDERGNMTTCLTSDAEPKGKSMHSSEFQLNAATHVLQGGNVAGPAPMRVEYSSVCLLGSLGLVKFWVWALT